MKTRKISPFFAVALVAALLFVCYAGVGAAAPGEPLLSIKPQATYLKLDLIVEVPDPALSAALHAATGIPAGDALTSSALAALSGTLDLSGKGIANAEGLQYCVNLTGLYLAGDGLTALPDKMNKLTKLKIIILEHNQFTVFPSALLTMPGITEIRLGFNAIEALPSGISSIAALSIFDISNNKLKELPASIGSLGKLKIFYCGNNELKKLPKELFSAPSLETLDFTKNRLTALPAEVKNAPKLKALSVQYNMISKLPEGLGEAPKLEYLLAGFNALTEVQPALFAGNIKNLVLDGNRIRKLPDALQGKSYQILRIEWNFLDVSPGSKDRGILDSLVIANSIFYQNQLTPVEFVSSSVTKDSTTLKWKALSSGSSGGNSWEVKKYEVYDATESPAKLLQTLDETVDGCTLSGLAPGKEYSFFVRVYYDVTVAAGKSGTSCDTTIKKTTEAEPTAAPTLEPTVAPTVEPTAAPTEAATATPAVETATADAAVVTTAPPASEPPAASAAPASTAAATVQPSASASSAPASAGAQQGGSGLMIALIAVGAAVLVAVVVLIVLQLRKPRTIRIRR